MKKAVIAAVAALSLLALSGPGWGIDKALLESAGLQELKEEAPEFMLLSPSGEKMRLKDLRGKVVIVHIWATWCKPCRDEFPLLDKLHRNTREKGVFILPIAIDRNLTRKEVEAFAKGLGAGFDVYLSKDGDITQRYWGWGVPATYFIDRNGLLRARAIGPREWGSAGVAAFIDALLNETR